MEITINLPEWIAYIGVILIALWAADKTLLLIKKYYEWRIRKLKKENTQIEKRIRKLKKENTQIEKENTQIEKRIRKLKNKSK